MTYIPHSNVVHLTTLMGLRSVEQKGGSYDKATGE